MNLNISLAILIEDPTSTIQSYKTMSNYLTTTPFLFTLWLAKTAGQKHSLKHDVRCITRVNVQNGCMSVYVGLGLFTGSFVKWDQLCYEQKTQYRCRVSKNISERPYVRFFVVAKPI